MLSQGRVTNRELNPTWALIPWNPGCNWFVLSEKVETVLVGWADMKETSFLEQVGEGRQDKEPSDPESLRDSSTSLSS